MAQDNPPFRWLWPSFAGSDIANKPGPRKVYSNWDPQNSLMSDEKMTSNYYQKWRDSKGELTLRTKPKDSEVDEFISWVKQNYPDVFKTKAVGLSRNDQALIERENKKRTVNVGIDGEKNIGTTEENVSIGETPSEIASPSSARESYLGAKPLETKPVDKKTLVNIDQRNTEEGYWINPDGSPDVTAIEGGSSVSNDPLDVATKRGDYLMAGMGLAQLPVLLQKRKIIPELPSPTYVSPSLYSGSASFKAAQSESIDRQLRSNMDYATRTGNQRNVGVYDAITAEAQKNIAGTQMDMDAINKQAIARAEAVNKTKEARQMSIEKGIQMQAAYDSALAKERSEALNNIFSIGLSNINMHNKAAEIKSLISAGQLQLPQ